MKRYIVLLILLMGAGFIIQKLIITPQFPNCDFALLPAIPVFFIIYGIGTYKIVSSILNPSVLILLGIKTVKILLSLVFILLYVYLDKESSKTFLVSYLAYFIIYLGFETWMLSTMNKKTKNNNEQISK